MPPLTGEPNAIESTERRGDVLIVRLGGAIQHETSAQLQVDLLELIARQQPACVVLNLAGVDYMDSSGIAVLVVARRRLGGTGGCVVLAAAQDRIAGLLRAVRLDTIFPIVPTEEAAVEHHGHGA